MSEHTLIQQQRDLLRRLHAFIAERIQAEVDAAARLKSEQEASEAALGEFQQQADVQLDKMHAQLETAQLLLRERGYQKVLAEVKPKTPTSQQGTDPAQEIDRCSSMAAQAFDSLEAKLGGGKHGAIGALIYSARLWPFFSRRWGGTNLLW